MEKHEDEERFSLRRVTLVIGCCYQTFEEQLHSSLHSHDGCQGAGSPERLGDIQNAPL